MGNQIIIANWKANKTPEEAREWLGEVQSSNFKVQSSCEIVVCPPYVLLPILKEQLAMQQSNNLTIHLGSQDISRFEAGPYTGEITGEMLKGLVDYVIVGHSERRKYFWETEKILAEKAERALKAGLKPIYCISAKEMTIPEGVQIVAYEPLFAIGTGSPDTPENADFVAGEIKKRQKVKVLYGGSVKPENAKGFRQKPNIDGLLVGGASLSAADFLAIIQNAA